MKKHRVLDESCAGELPTDFSGKVFVFAGTPSSMSLSKAKALVTMIGGFARTSLSPKTNFLVLSEKERQASTPSAKHKQALALQASGQDIRIITENVFRIIVKKSQEQSKQWLFQT